MSPKIIMHVDLDAFYAAVEEREHPEYEGKPIVVGADPKNGKGRGVVVACNYEARKFGMHSGMPISVAWRTNRNAVFLPPNHRLYGEVSSRIMRILRSHADRFEQASIDEAFLDVSQRAGSYQEAKMLAQEIKHEIMNKEGLTCSIGIGPHKLVAKIASDFQKPNGLTLVEENNVKSFLSPLPISKLIGIGRKTEKILNEMGIRTIGELGEYGADRLRRKLGTSGVFFHRMAQGIDTSRLVEEWAPRSFSREHTFEEDTSDKDLVLRTLDNLLKDVTEEAEQNGFQYRTVTVKIRYEDFETHTRSKTIPLPKRRSDAMRLVAHQLSDPFLTARKKIRLIGVKASNLDHLGKQMTLIEL